jgi:hypothetical protein
MPPSYNTLKNKAEISSRNVGAKLLRRANRADNDIKLLTQFYLSYT